MHRTTPTTRTTRRRARLRGLAVAALAGGLTLSATATAPAQADGDADRRALGNRSLAKVLAADGQKFDQKGKDFDIVEAAVVAVLGDDPESPVSLLTKGRQRATAFLPTDQAFRVLVEDLTGTAPKREAKVFSTLAGAADIETIETVLLYHVVAGQTLTAKKVVPAAQAGTEITMASGGTIQVELRKGKVVLVDADTDDRDARAIPALLDINKGNKQVAHGINRVLRPIDL